MKVLVYRWDKEEKKYLKLEEIDPVVDTAWHSWEARQHTGSNIRAIESVILSCEILSIFLTEKEKTNVPS